MKSLTRSQAARRRAAAAAAVASVGAGFLGTQSAEAEIVPIDLTNVNGQNFTGVNAGLSAGSGARFSMSFGAAGALEFNVKNRQNNFYRYTGLQALGGQGGIANGGSINTPTQYSFGDPISGSASAFLPGNFGLNPLFYYKYNGVHAAPSFDGYLGFLSSGTDGDGTNGVYGWIRATWDGTNFQLYSAAYESTPGQSITAGVVPEPSTTALLGLGALALGAGAVRKQRAARRTQAAAAMSA